MNIRNGIDSLAQIAPQEKLESNLAGTSATNSPAESAQTDKAVFSVTGSKLALLPEESTVRLDKVSSIQHALASGTYQVNATDVAKKVISSILSVKG